MELLNTSSHRLSDPPTLYPAMQCIHDSPDSCGGGESNTQMHFKDTLHSLH